MIPRLCFLGVFTFLTSTAMSCELCAIYSADSAADQSARGFSLNVSGQFVPFGTVQRNGRALPHSILDQAFVDTSMNHFAPTWNFSERFGVSLSLPVVHHRFSRFQLTSTNILTESGSETGLGDLALIARYSPIRRVTKESSLIVNLLGGVKFPTGDPQRLREEVASFRELDAIYGVGHQHAVSGVHLRDLTLGSGSYDGVFGVTVNSRWKRWFFNGQFQYYLRTPGAAGYEFGDELLVSGGPGAFVVLEKKFTLSLQALAVCDSRERDTVLGRQNNNSGMTAWYLGPQVNVTMGLRFNASAGVDVPLTIDNHGLQNVPDFRLHAGVSFRF